MYNIHFFSVNFIHGVQREVMISPSLLQIFDEQYGFKVSPRLQRIWENNWWLKRCQYLYLNCKFLRWINKKSYWSSKSWNVCTFIFRNPGSFYPKIWIRLHDLWNAFFKIWTRVTRYQLQAANLWHILLKTIESRSRNLDPEVLC